MRTKMQIRTSDTTDSIYTLRGVERNGADTYEVYITNSTSGQTSYTSRDPREKCWKSVSNLILKPRHDHK